MVKKSITIPEEIYDAVKDEDNFSSLVTELLAKHIHCRRIDDAKASFGAISELSGCNEPDIDSVDYVNMMRDSSRLF